MNRSQIPKLQKTSQTDSLMMITMSENLKEGTYDSTGSDDI